VYCGTEVGVYRSTDTGASWSRFGSGLPAVSIRSLAIRPDGTLLRAATYGRGLFEVPLSARPNTPPSVAIVRPSAALTVTPGSSVEFLASASDPDGDPVSVTW